MRAAFRVLAILIALGVVVQAGTIALAWFTVLGELNDGAVLSEDSERNLGHNVHGIVGMMVMPVLGLALLIVSFFAKIPSGVTWAAIVFGLVVLQVALAIVSFGVSEIGALHGINALVLAAVAGRAGALGRDTAPASSTPAGTRASA
jgi:hypothetical protein